MMLHMLEEVADALGEALRAQVAFVGGCTTVLLITDEYTLESVRGTDDVDLVIHLAGTADWYRLEEHLKPPRFQKYRPGFCHLSSATGRSESRLHAH